MAPLPPFADDAVVVAVLASLVWAARPPLHAWRLTAGAAATVALAVAVGWWVVLAAAGVVLLAELFRADDPAATGHQ